MTYPISDVTRRVVYSGSAGTGPYGFSFEILTENDIGVYKNNLLQTLTTDYTVTINADGTGSITLTSAATADDTIAIYGTKGIARTTDFVTGGDLFANSLNDELDAQTIFAQQNAEAILRSLRAPVTDPTTIDMRLPLKADRAGRILGFNDTTGNPEVGPLMSKVETLAAVSEDIALLADLQDGTTSLDVLSDLADIKDDLDAIGGISSDIQTLAAIATDIQTLADIEDGTDATDAIQTVAGMNTDITSLLAIADDISTVADNVADVTNFADVYLGPSATDPIQRNDGSALQAGDLYFNTGVNALKTYNGSAWIEQGGLQNIVEDTTPQLGGNLDTNGSDIVVADNDYIRVGTTGLEISSNSNTTTIRNNSTYTGGFNIYANKGFTVYQKNDGVDQAAYGIEYSGGALLYSRGSPRFGVAPDYNYSYTHIQPTADDLYDLGAQDKKWRNLWIDGKAYCDGIETYDIYLGNSIIYKESTAALQVDSDSRGFLPPRMTSTQRDAITSPATGLMIYNTTTNKINFYNGTAWRAIDDSAV